VESTGARLELRLVDAEEVEGLEVDDVEAAAAVHQYLGEPGVDDDGVDDERVDTRGDYSVGVVVSIEGDGGARLVEVLGHRHPCRKNLTAFSLALPCGQLRRGSAIDHVAVMDGREVVVVFVVPFVAALLFLLVITGVLPEPQAVEMLFQHATVLELVVGPSLMIRARLLQHLVEDAHLWRASRLFALHGGDEIVVEIFPLERSRLLLLLLVLLGPSTGALVVIGELLIFPSFTAEEGPDRFFPCGVVCHHVHQLVDGLRAIPAQLPHQVSTCGTRDEG